MLGFLFPLYPGAIVVHPLLLWACSLVGCSKSVVSSITPMDREFLKSQAWRSVVFPILQENGAPSLDAVCRSQRPRKIPMLGGVIKRVEMLHYDALVTLFDFKGAPESLYVIGAHASLLRCPFTSKVLCSFTGAIQASVHKVALERHPDLMRLYSCAVFQNVSTSIAQSLVFFFLIPPCLCVFVLKLSTPSLTARNSVIQEGKRTSNIFFSFLGGWILF